MLTKMKTATIKDKTTTDTPAINPASSPVDSLWNQLPSLTKDVLLGLIQFGCSAIEKYKQISVVKLT